MARFGKLFGSNEDLNIAVTGERGAGKSSFVNALRGLTESDARAAPVGVVETTMAPTAYPHPTMPNVKFWDLPGMGITTCDAGSYAKKVKFQNYDYFIIVSAATFKENEINLAKEVKKKKKNFYFVCSKMDIDVTNAEKSGMTEAETLQEIRDKCVKHLADLGPPPVFLITSTDQNKFDFPKLKDILRVSSENNTGADRARELLGYLDNVVLNIAITGESGAGKSSFVNAIRGVNDSHKLSAKVDEDECTKEPTVYSHPTVPNLNIWDLPGIGTNTFDAGSYAKQMKFQNYDFFIIVSATRVRENDIKLGKEIKQKKKNFYFVRSKIDTDVANSKRRNKTEEETLQTTRGNCVENLSVLGSPLVFLITSRDRNRFDFPKLLDALEKDHPENRRKIDRARELASASASVALNIAVTGESGVGKSSFVNAIRGVNDTDILAAKVDENECTKEPTVYPHPTMPNVKIWDLPGIGTTTFDAASYTKNVKFKNYDLFIIVSATRFKENDIKLAKEIKKMKKSFYFVCSKIDIDVTNAEKRMTEAETLQEIRDKCVKHLADLGPPPVFLITSTDQNKFDFPKLKDILERVSAGSKTVYAARELLGCLDVVLNIAVTGESGTGKSSFVNAIRGLNDTDKLAAKVDEDRSNIEPTVYSHPTIPNLNFWDLPGIGTTRLDAASYAKQMKFQNYDLFIIVSMRLKENEIKVGAEINKRNRKFYLVHSKTDFDVTNATARNVTEEDTLRKIRDDCERNFSELGSPPVFLITSRDRNRFDFPNLVETLVRDMPENRREIDRARELASASVGINIAVTGESGVGKSSFVNAIRGLNDTDILAAEVGENECTKEPTVYPHPTMPNVKIWDLPGIGTTTFDAASYTKNVKFKNYDLFIIVSASRFRENDIKLAKEIIKMEKNFYFVRSKTDFDVANARERDVTEEETLKKIRESCEKSLIDLRSPPVFLITSHDLSRFDFPKLVETLETDLPENKRDALALSLPVYSHESLEKKYKKLKKTVWALAAVSGGIGGVPVPGLSTAIHVAMAVSFFTKCYHSFGLDDKSLIKLGKRVNQPILARVQESKLIQALAKKTLPPDLLMKLLLTGAVGTAFIFVPVAGNIIAAGVSFATTRSVLSEGLEELYNSAKIVIEMAGLP